MAPELIAGSAAVEDPPRVGLRGVFLEEPDRAYVNLVASPTASYLLPDLLPGIQDVSYGVLETREPRGILIVGNSVIVRLSVPEHSPEPRHLSVFDRLSVAPVVTAPAPLAEPPVERSISTPPTTSVVDNAHGIVETTSLPGDASMQAIASRIRELSGLSDARLGDLFKVTRETFNRWRSGAMTNPTAGTRRRVGMVLHLLEELTSRGVSVNDWLQNPNAIDGVTPYDLLRKGRVDEAAHLAAAIDEEPTPARAEADEEALVFEDDDEGWESFDIEVVDDED